MRSAAATIIEQLAANRRMAYCRLVETRGSTPQKPGAVMLVFEDGQQAGTLGGGCVEAEVKRRALAVLQHGIAEVSSFQLDHDYGWDDGLICGGRMQVLIQPVIHAAGHYFESLAAQMKHGRGGTECIVFAQGKHGIPPPVSLLFDEHQQLMAGVPGDLEESATRLIASQLQPLVERLRPYAIDGVAYLPILPRCRLIIVGGGHVGRAIAHLARDLEFDVWVVDDRAEYVSPARFPDAERRISGDLNQLLPELEITRFTYCLIVTRGHQHDQEALFHLAGRQAAYVGLIGSRRKIRMIFDNLLAEGVAPEALDEVYAPIGIDIGSQTVAEIAISVAAELVGHRNRGGKVPGRMRDER